MPAAACLQTVAGTGILGASDGPAERASFSAPHSVLPLSDGSCLVTDSGNDALRHVSLDASGGFTVSMVGPRGFGWLRPRGLALLPDGGVLVCDSGHNRVRLLGADGRVSVFCGNGQRGFSDGPAKSARFDAPSGLCVCVDGTVLVCDSGNHCIRAVAGRGNRRVVRTLAGTGRPGCADGPAERAAFSRPTAVLALGGPEEAESVIYVADAGNSAVRMISTDESRQLAVATLAGRPGVPGHVDGPLAEGLLSSPAGLAVHADGTLLVSDEKNNNVRRIDLNTRSIDTLAGGVGWGHVDGEGDAARFNVPRGLALGPSGEVWVADAGNNCVRMLTDGAEPPVAPPPAPPPAPPLPASAWTEPVPREAQPPNPQPSRKPTPGGGGKGVGRSMRLLRQSGGRAASAATSGGVPGLPPGATDRTANDRMHASPLRPSASAPSLPPASRGGKGGGSANGGGANGVAAAGGQTSRKAASPRGGASHNSSTASGRGGRAGSAAGLSDADRTLLYSDGSAAFAADAQLFERSAAAGAARGSWTYTGAASVTVSAAPGRPTTATLAVQVHGAASVESSVVRPSQLTLRDAVFVVCGRGADGKGYKGFGCNELGLRFRSASAAAALLAAVEEISAEPPADTAEPPPQLAAPPAAPTPTPAPPALPAPRSPDDGLWLYDGSASREARKEDALIAAAGPMPGTPKATPGRSRLPVRSASKSAPKHDEPTAPTVGASAENDVRLQRAEQDVLRLSARLAEREIEVGKLLRRLEQTQAAVRSRDAKIAELSRRLLLATTKAESKAA